MFSIATFTMLVAGCTTWPVERGGGAAEVSPLPPTQILLGSTETSWVGTLYMRLEFAEAELERITALGGMEKTPAAITLARGLSIRVRRELAGGLIVDAARDLLSLEEYVTQMVDIYERVVSRADFGIAPGKDTEG